ncbi:MAG: DoxX family protein [Pedosphaera sp.]|nr:DoxX family protein [Pedosphaera sp.]
MNPRLEPALTLLGRILLSLIFILSAGGKIADWPGTAGYMASKGMVAIPVLLTLAIVFELGGGLSVLLGFKARWGALALIIFLITASVIFHNFWAYTGAEKQTQMVHFLKNLSIMGGLLLVVARGAGKPSLDARRKTK